MEYSLADPTRITQYSTDLISQKRLFVHQPYDHKRFNVYPLSGDITKDDELVTDVLNLRFPILSFEETTHLDFFNASEKPTIFIKWPEDMDNLARFPDSFLKKCCILEMRRGMAPISRFDYEGNRTVPPARQTNTVTINGVDVKVFALYIVPVGSFIPQYTDDSNELSFYELSGWLSGMVNMNLHIPLPDYLSLDVETRASAEKHEYTDPEVYERMNAPVSPAQHYSQELAEYNYTDEPVETFPVIKEEEKELTFEANAPDEKDKPSTSFSSYTPKSEPSQSSSFTTPQKPTSYFPQAPMIDRVKRVAPTSAKKLDLFKILLLDEDEPKAPEVKKEVEESFDFWGDDKTKHLRIESYL